MVWKNTKLLAVFLAAVFSLALPACGASDGRASDDADQAEPSSVNSEKNVVVDPALQNEVHVTSDEPYVMSGDQTYWVEDKVLNNGYTMPVLGIGTYALTVEQAENSVYWALRDGVRLVDQR